MVNTLDAGLEPLDQTLPDLGLLQSYEVLIWFTGDNFLPSGSLDVPTPLTENDQDLMIAYLQSGGKLIATGQDLTDASDIEVVPPDERYGRSDLYHGYLGARWVSDNVFFLAEEEGALIDRDFRAQGIAPWFAGLQVDLSLLPEGMGPSGETGAGNQETVDEITIVDSDPRIPPQFVTPIFQAVNPVNGTQGLIGLSRSAEPTLEQPTLGIPYRSLYLSFGLEGVRNDLGLTTRTELLQSLLWWITDQPAVTLDTSAVAVTAAGESFTFNATATSTAPTEFVRYRWDFGDGSGIVETTEPTVSHTYNTPGTYQVRVEATNTWGHSALSPLAPVTPGPVGQQDVPTAADPMMGAPLTFPETGQSIQGRFREFWETNGGLAVFGYPLTPQQPVETGVMAQMFERNRFEYHAENPAPYDVLLGRMGVEELEAAGRDWWTFPTVDSAPEGCLYFAETRHSLCGEFLAYWQGHGLEFDGIAGTSYAESLALFGLPISEPQEETLEDGSVRIVQWFERARFELHPENAPPYHVLLGRLGSSE